MRASTTGTRIITKHGEITKIAQIFNKSMPAIRRALRGNKTVINYNKIRKCAIERGGIEMTEVQKDDTV